MLKFKIEGLFGRFNYELEFKNDVTILTGPNGYGKTTILQCIEALSKANLLFFKELNFNKIEVIFENKEYNILLVKTPKELIVNKEILALNSIKNNSHKPATIHRVTLENLKPITTCEIEEVFSRRDEVCKAIGIVYFIRDQRIWKRQNNKSKHIVETINELSDKLQTNINHLANQYSALSNELDSTYPFRLYDAHISIKEEYYQKEMHNLKAKFEKLVEYNLIDSQIFANFDNLKFNAEKSIAIKLYIDDFTKKYQVYEDFIIKLDLFTSIINSKLTFKQIKISRINGIQVITDTGEVLSLNQLSSGEQQQIILFYELIFDTNINELILIDEPEISLHIVWLKSFMEDLLQIIKYKGFRVIVSTHSPQILSNYWDRQIDLGGLYNDQLN
ncbi:MAG: hypothetical protein ATN35_00625 [Epulopiscium sp. Nele67-Bin004]|nr:MAG: hypothetical protein ATN35_00625 [Epulopiscium sp. Nele67-Bin004]